MKKQKSQLRFKTEQEFIKEFGQEKLMFKEWEIEVTNTCIDIGCKTYTKEMLRNFLFIIKEIEREAKETETEVNVQLYNIIQFLKKHKEELGL